MYVGRGATRHGWRITNEAIYAFYFFRLNGIVLLTGGHQTMPDS